MTHEAPNRCGIGLRRDHYEAVLNDKPDVPWFEVISENFMQAGGRPRHALERVRRDYPIAIHGVSLSAGSAQSPNEMYLERLEALIDFIDPVIVSDHLCWSAIGGHYSHDLLPIPATGEALEVVSVNIARVQDRLGRRILVENISTYVEFRTSEMSEWEFVTAVLERADCFLLLDVNNVYVNARNHGFDPRAYLDAIPVERVRQFHLAGHEDHGDYVVDTHDHAVCDDVWALFRYALTRFGPLPTILERDDHLPELPELLEEAGRATALMEPAHVATVG